MLSWRRLPPAVASRALWIDVRVSVGSSSMRPSRRTRAPWAFSSAVSFRMTFSSRKRRPPTSSSERAQFSRLKAYRDSTSMPRRTEWRMTSRIASTPAAWPSISDWPRAFAQRRLPSMMIATWRGSSSRGTTKGSVGAASGDAETAAAASAATPVSLWTSAGESVGRRIRPATRPPGFPAPWPHRRDRHPRHACR